MIPLSSCPFAGIICIECSHPIRPDDKHGMERQIGVHEKRTHAKVTASEYKLRETFVQQHNNKMREMARSIKDILLVDEELAKKTYLDYVGDITSYYYCSHPECRKLVSSKDHQSRNHASKCNEMRNGVTSRLWTTNSPKVIPIDNFDFTNPDYFSIEFYNYLNDRTNVATKCSCGSTAFTGTVCCFCHVDIANDKVNQKSLALQNLLTLQSDQNDASTTIDVVDQKLTPNLWIFHTGWDKILDGYVFSDIYAFVNKIPNKLEQRMIDALTQMLHGVVVAVKKIEPTHQIMSDVQRRTKYHDITARFPFNVFKCDSTWERYFRTITKMSLVVFRMIEMVCNSNINGTTTVPTPKFTKQQKNSYMNIKLCELEDGSERSLLYIEFLISLVDVTIHKEMSNVAVLMVLAMISVKDDDSLADAISTTPVIAAFIAVYKLLFLAKSIGCFTVNDKNDDDSNDDDDNDSDEDKDEHEDESWVKQLHSYIMKHFFVNDFGTVHSPITAMIKIFHYGKQIAREQTGIGTIRWENDTVIHRDVSLSITNYRWCIQSGIDKITALLLKLLRLGNCNQLPSIPWEKIIDDQTNNRPHYSFLTEEGNQQWLRREDHMNSLKNRLANEIMCDNHKIKSEFINLYEKQIKEFLKILLVLMHVTGGQPARGTEITNLTYINTSHMPRNISVYRGLVCFCTTYHKSMSHTGKLKRIFRFLPEPVGTVLVHYLWLILPFWQRIKEVVTPSTTKSPHLWTKQAAASTLNTIKTEVWGTESLSQGLSSLFVDNKMNVRVYRHVIVAIARRFLKESWGSETEEDEVNEEFGDGANDVSICNHILDLQAGHTTETAVRVYARGAAENRTTYQGNMDEYCDSSIKHHNFIFNRPSQLMNSTTTLDQLKEQVYRQKYFQLLQKERLQALLAFDLDIALRSFMKNKNNVSFRGNQRKTIEAIVERHSLILQIAPTGVGKTLSFMLPAYMSYGGTTIVVVPLVALQQDLLSRCLSCNITATIWNPATLPSPSKIVLVSPESVTSKAFLDFINMLQDGSMLDRIVLDECHLYLTSNDEYRPDMMNVSNMVQSYGVQTLLMTATLPERFQSELLKKLNLDKVPITVLRDPTTRKNIRYEVCHVGHQPLLSIVQSILNEPRFQNERIIIYVKTIKDGEQLSADLQLPFYYANAPEKKNVLDHWILATVNRVIIATSAMGCGIDVPDVRLVLHAGSPKTMIEFSQQSGRAGRDGNVSFSITLHRKFDGKYMEHEMLQYINGHGNCRRIALDYAMDSIERGQCLSSECPCDCCCKQMSVVDESRSISPTTVMAVTPFVSMDNHGLVEKSFDNNNSEQDKEYGDDDDVGGIELEDSDNKDRGVSMMDSFLVTPQVSFDVLTPHAQLPLGTNAGHIPSNSNDAEGLEMQRKRLFVEQGLMQEQRKRSNYQEVQKEESFDVQMLEHFLSIIPSFVNGCFMCRILNQTGPCTNQKEHNKKRYEIEKERKLVGDKVNKCGKSYAGLSIPAYCSCTMPGCYVPQMFCASWESNGSGGYKWVRQNCNHRDKLLDVVIALRDSNDDAAVYLLEKSDGDLTKLLTTKILCGREKLLLLHRVYIDMCKKFID